MTRECRSWSARRLRSLAVAVAVGGLAVDATLAREARERLTLGERAAIDRIHGILQRALGVVSSPVLSTLLAVAGASDLAVFRAAIERLGFEATWRAAVRPELARRAGSSRPEGVSAAEHHRSRLRPLASADPPAALLAYADRAPVGWVAVAPRSQYARLVRSPVAKAVDGCSSARASSRWHGGDRSAR